jgi:hypothetical protein
MKGKRGRKEYYGSEEKGANRFEKRRKETGEVYVPTNEEMAVAILQPHQDQWSFSAGTARGLGTPGQFKTLA